MYCNQSYVLDVCHRCNLRFCLETLSHAKQADPFRRLCICRSSSDFMQPMLTQSQIHLSPWIRWAIAFLDILWNVFIYVESLYGKQQVLSPQMGPLNLLITLSRLRSKLCKAGLPQYQIITRYCHKHLANCIQSWNHFEEAKKRCAWLGSFTGCSLQSFLYNLEASKSQAAINMGAGHRWF